MRIGRKLGWCWYLVIGPVGRRAEIDLAQRILRGPLEVIVRAYQI